MWHFGEHVAPAAGAVLGARGGIRPARRPGKQPKHSDAALRRDGVALHRESACGFGLITFVLWFLRRAVGGV